MPHVPSGTRRLTHSLWCCLPEALRPTCEQALGLVQGVEGSGWLPHCEQEPAASSPLSLPSKAFCNSQSVDKSNLMRGAQEAPMRPPKVKILYLVRHGEAIHNIKEQQAQQKAAADCTAVGLLPASKEFKVHDNNNENKNSNNNKNNSNDNKNNKNNSSNNKFLFRNARPLVPPNAGSSQHDLFLSFVMH
ncbi:unnamed protein product [Polarella glacialis]|uniref:Uncharacterized protein n=1 Tax=Polarella glacialis TaxID=89957 RepID=A0A813DQ99_POLGL|nr:unnamed protein product [Polarella glacialis]